LPEFKKTASADDTTRIFVFDSLIGCS
jgi:hypothetical protein